MKNTWQTNGPRLIVPCKLSGLKKPLVYIRHTAFTRKSTRLTRGARLLHEKALSLQQKPGKDTRHVSTMKVLDGAVTEQSVSRAFNKHSAYKAYKPCALESTWFICHVSCVSCES